MEKEMKKERKKKILMGGFFNPLLESQKQDQLAKDLNISKMEGEMGMLSGRDSPKTKAGMSKNTSRRAENFKNES